MVMVYSFKIFDLLNYFFFGGGANYSQNIRNHHSQYIDHHQHVLNHQCLVQIFHHHHHSCPLVEHKLDCTTVWVVIIQAIFFSLNNQVQVLVMSFQVSFFYLKNWYEKKTISFQQTYYRCISNTWCFKTIQIIWEQ